MDTQTVDAFHVKYPLGELLNEGKTKKVWAVDGRPDLVDITAKDDITAGDGAKHDVIPNKGALATQTTCNVFRLLAKCGIPVAFVEQDSSTSFVAKRCSMLLYEVVVRREAHGSYLKRNPHLAKGQLFPRLLVEFFLKTSGKRWGEHELICDDPLMFSYSREFWKTVGLYDPAKPIFGQKPFLELPTESICSVPYKDGQFEIMRDIARRTFLVLEKAWQLQERTLVDFKVEFGFDTEDNLLLADVIDNDSWRVLENGQYIDKQVYRDGGEISEVARRYRQVAELTNQFSLPTQQIVLWRGSASDSFDPFKLDEMRKAVGKSVLVEKVTCSAHRQPVQAFEELCQRVQQVPDTVIIAYVGRSNGLGPMLAANTTVPVITVPTNFKDFPDDIWSSLRTPSNVPVLTVLEPADAVAAAKRILSARNPHLYALERAAMEERMENFVCL